MRYSIFIIGLPQPFAKLDYDALKTSFVTSIRSKLISCLLEICNLLETLGPYAFRAGRPQTRPPGGLHVPVCSSPPNPVS